MVFTEWVKAVEKVRPHWHFFIVWPDEQSGFKWDDDGFFQRPNVTRISQRISPRKRSNAVTFFGPWYDAFFRAYAVDIVWANLVEIAAQIKFSGETVDDVKSMPIVVAAHNYVIHKTLPYRVEDTQPHLIMLQLMGAAVSDANVFNSDHCQWMFFDNASRFLSTAAIEDIQAKSYKINYGPLGDEFARLPRGQNDIPIIAYNHRLQKLQELPKDPSGIVRATPVGGSVQALAYDQLQGRYH